MPLINSASKTLSFQPPIIAHRGASALAPENTLVAFRQAKAIGAQWVEFDVMLSADGKAIVIHDETIDRTTNAQGRVADLSQAYLQSLDAGSWFDKKFAGAKIPTLIEVIQLLNELKLFANIEIKPCAGYETETVKTVMAIVEKYWQQAQAPLVSSFSHAVLEDVRRLSNDTLLGFLMHDWEADWQQKSDALNCVTVHVFEELLTADRAREIKAAKRLLMSYTVDEPKRARELFAYGVDAIFSNCENFKILEQEIRRK